jgi:hypothetical protein
MKEKKYSWEKLVKKTVDFIFSKDLRKWLILIFIFGFLFRLINVRTRMVYGDPAHFITNAINFLNSGLLVVWGQSAFLWNAMTDVFYKIFGVTQFASRFPSLLFGTFTIIAIYLFVKEFFESKPIAFMSAIIYALAPVFIFNTSDEHDIAVLFFIIMTFYTLIKGLKNNSKKYLLISSAFLGISCMWKMYVPILIIPYIGMIIYFSHFRKKNLKTFEDLNKENKNEFDYKKHIKTFIWMLIILFLLLTPTLAYNYLNYKHNEVTTMFFCKFFKFLSNEKTNELYSWDPGYANSFSSSVIFTGLKNSIYNNSAVLCLLSILGIIFMIIKRKNIFAKDYLIFYSLYFIIPYFFLIQSNTLSKHYIHFIAFAIPFISFMIVSLYKSLNKKIGLNKFIKKNLAIFIIFLILFQFFMILSLPHNVNKELLFSGNSENKFMKYKENNIPENSLIIYDDRIYNSLATWIFNDRYYISVNSLNQFMTYNQQSTNKINIPVFIIECGIDDCGWGTIKDNPQLNQSMENFFSDIKAQSTQKVLSVKEQIRGLNYYNPLINKKESENEYFIVYKTNLAIDMNLAKEFKKQYNSFFYPLRYENKAQPIFQNFIYKPKGFFESTLNNFAWFIFYLEIILSLLAIIFISYELYKSD